ALNMILLPYTTLFRSGGGWTSHPMCVYWEHTHREREDSDDAQTPDLRAHPRHQPEDQPPAAPRRPHIKEDTTMTAQYPIDTTPRSEEHTSELQSRENI